YDAPQHPYTRALLASRLSMNPRERVARPPLSGDPPNPIDPPSGCRFRTRCPIAEDICAQREPMLAAIGASAVHLAACHACDLGSGHTRAAPVEATQAQA